MLKSKIENIEEHIKQGAGQLPVIVQIEEFTKTNASSKLENLGVDIRVEIKKFNSSEFSLVSFYKPISKMYNGK